MRIEHLIQRGGGTLGFAEDVQENDWYFWPRLGIEVRLPGFAQGSVFTKERTLGHNLLYMLVNGELFPKPVFAFEVDAFLFEVVQNEICFLVLHLKFANQELTFRCQEAGLSLAEMYILLCNLFEDQHITNLVFR